MSERQPEEWDNKTVTIIHHEGRVILGILVVIVFAIAGVFYAAIQRYGFERSVDMLIFFLVFGIGGGSAYLVVRGTAGMFTKHNISMMHADDYGEVERMKAMPGGSDNTHLAVAMMRMMMEEQRQRGATDRQITDKATMMAKDMLARRDREPMYSDEWKEQPDV